MRCPVQNHRFYTRPYLVMLVRLLFRLSSYSLIMPEEREQTPKTLTLLALMSYSPPKKTFFRKKTKAKGSAARMMRFMFASLSHPPKDTTKARRMRQLPLLTAPRRGSVAGVGLLPPCALRRQRPAIKSLQDRISSAVSRRSAMASFV